jgi:hypothetical protein
LNPSHSTRPDPFVRGVPSPWPVDYFAEGRQVMMLKDIVVLDRQVEWNVEREVSIRQIVLYVAVNMLRLIKEKWPQSPCDSIVRIVNEQ